MPLTDISNKPIPMNGEHPAHDLFGTSIDHGDTYYITPTEEIVHVINTDEYFVHVMKCEVVKVED